MPTRYPLVLALALLFAASPAPAQGQADRGADPSPTQEAIDHIRVLEAMLRDAGLHPPARPDSLRGFGGQGQQPLEETVEIVPDWVQINGLEAEVRALREHTDDAANALTRIRRWLTRDDQPERQQSAAEVMLAVQQWVDAQVERVEAWEETDIVTAYMIADEALQIVSRDPMGQPLRDFVNQLREDPQAWREIEAMARYRRIIGQADAIGLTGDWSLIDFGDARVEEQIIAIRNRLGIIARGWPGTDGGNMARDILEDWADQEQQIVASLPAWRYTWNISLIHLGTEVDTTYYEIETVRGTQVIIDQDIDQVFDQRNIMMSGTFQNTSDRAYQYTFVVAVSTLPEIGLHWISDRDRLAGFTRIQTPVLRPGELYNWQVEIAVHNAYSIRHAGVGDVEANDPAGSGR